MTDISLPNIFKLKIIFLLHVLLTSISSIGHWVPSAYLFYNSLIVLVLLWILHNRDNFESLLELTYCMNGCAVILDVFVLAFCFPNHGGGEFFSAIFAILHLIVRPITTYYLLQLYREVAGSSGGFVDNIFSKGTNQSPYEDIAGVSGVQQQTPRGYDFSSAEQI